MNVFGNCFVFFQLYSDVFLGEVQPLCLYLKAEIPNAKTDI